jgi:TolA-binding protein
MSKGDLPLRISTIVEEFIVRRKWTIILSLAGVVVLAAAYFSVIGLTNSRETAAENDFGKVYARYREEKSKDTGGDTLSLIGSFEVVLEDYPHTAAASKAAYFIGNIQFDHKEYEKALDSYLRGSEIKPKDYSALLCMKRAGACYEELERYEDAVGVYLTILDRYQEYFIIPTVIYKLAQLYEMLDRIEDAKKQYNRLITDFSWSSWSKLAEKQLLYLKSLSLS